jgi:hypothetical protein
MPPPESVAVLVSNDELLNVVMPPSLETAPACSRQ